MSKFSDMITGLHVPNIVSPSVRVDKGSGRPANQHRRSGITTNKVAQSRAKKKRMKRHYKRGGS